jgi:hypothetical protein
METQTRMAGFGKRFATACGIAVFALVLGLGSIADEAAAWGGFGRGSAIGTGRSAARPETVYQQSESGACRSGWGGGALATRK